MNEGIRVNTILPGIFATPLLMALPDAVLQSLAAGTPPSVWATRTNTRGAGRSG